MKAITKQRIVREIKPYIFLLPSAVLIFGLIYYPVLNAIKISFYEINVLNREMSFIGFQNYVSIFNEPLFGEIFWRTVLWTFSVLGGATLLALIVSQLLDIEFKFKRAVRGIFIIPWATSLAISAMLYRWALNAELGLINHTLKNVFHLIDQNIGWLATGEAAFPWIVYVGIWVSVPFTTLVLLAGLQTVPVDLYESAKLDGANWLQRYIHITLPFIRPVLFITVIINFIAIFNSFPIIWVMTEGGPLNSTDILVTFLYKEAFKFLDFGRASAVAVLIFVFLMIISVIYTLTLLKDEE